jgi:small-conductance mechanosensitive channel
MVLVAILSRALTVVARLALASLLFSLLDGSSRLRAADTPATERPPKTSSRSHATPRQQEKGEDAGSPAERINGIRKLLDADRTRLDELEIELGDLEREFETASSHFQEADLALTDARSEATNATSDSRPTRSEVEALATKRTEARDRFDRVIARRKAVQQQIDTLTEKIALEEQALERANQQATSTANAPPEIKQRQSDVEPDMVEQSKTTVEKSGDKSASPQTEEPAERTEESKSPEISLFPGITLPAGKAESQKVEKAKAETPKRVDQRTEQARQAVASVQRRLAEEQESSDLLDRSVVIFQRDLANSKQLLEAVHAELEATEKELKNAKRSTGDESREALQSRYDKLREEMLQQQSRIRESEDMLARLRARKGAVSDRVKTSQAELDAAERQVWFMESPLAPRRLYNWIAEVGPKVLVVLTIMFVTWWVIRLLGRRIVSGLLWQSERGTEFERQARAETLSRVFQSGGSMAVIVLGTLALLQQTGIDVTVLLGGAAVIGAALAFGSQNLIKDYFSGFMILAENQYSVGNVIRIGDRSGVVEDISLRLTVLRDEEGVVHFIPHNQVTTVSNLTHGWSRAVFAIGVGYREDVDRVIGLLNQLAQELRQDAKFGPDIIGDPEMQGVDALGDSAVMIKFLLKTRPLRQWAVKREMLRRIKKRFDQEGIEIPFPHQTIYYRSLEVENAEAPFASRDQ